MMNTLMPPGVFVMPLKLVQVIIKWQLVGKILPAPVTLVYPAFLINEITIPLDQDRTG
jgi:hypothetical protein